MLSFFQNMSKEQRNYLLIFFYVLIYYLFRLTCSPYLDWDEAEQYVLAQGFNFGDAHQPPLYSWIIKTLSLVFGYGTPVIVSVRYICLFVFLYFLYKAIRIFHDEDDSLLCLNSILALVLTYGYVINFKLTHSVLVFACASFCFYRYLKLLCVKDSIRNYIAFALSIALGMLAKFNFAFLILALILGSMFTSSGRALVFNLKSLLSIHIVSALISPYYLWLLNQGDEAKAYLSSRSVIENSDYNYFFNLFKLSFSAISPILIYILCFSLLLAFLFCRDNLKFQSILRNISIKSELIYISLVSYSLPILIFLFNKAGKLAGGWLAVTHFVAVIVIFTLCENFLEGKLKRRLQYIFLTINIVFFMIKVSWILLPDIHPKIHRLNIPYESFNQEIKNISGSNSFEYEICDDQIISANLNNLNHDNDVITINKRKEILTFIKEHKKSSLLLILNRVNLKQKAIKKLEAMLAKENLTYKAKKIKKRYLYSKNNFHELSVYLINPPE
ncbi:MAG: glycosyltransferase family 39 protein [Candidatus Caenarcaniphilales bacterium]|nr:glycosyltransferase family 39 protein [Candidatus Caenarcaniphilales bacterium]